MLVVWMGCAADAQPERSPLKPTRVCEAISEVEAGGKAVAVIGRFSFREYGRFLSEASCGEDEGTSSLQVIYDDNSGIKTPDEFVLDRTDLYEKLAVVKRKTRLKQFRFGSTEYDRWAVVYGRIEPLTESDRKGASRHGSEFAGVSGRLVCQSETMVVVIREP